MSWVNPEIIIAKFKKLIEVSLLYVASTALQKVEGLALQAVITAET